MKSSRPVTISLVLQVPMAGSERFLNVAVGVTALAAVASVLLAARREMRQPDVTARPFADTVAVSNWDSLRAGGTVIGNPSAPIQFVEFSDFECSFCQDAATGVLHQLLVKYPQQVAFRFYHAPSGAHRLGKAAAVAAVCAENQGRFREMHDALFKGADSLGLRSLSSFASEAGVPDSIAFVACLGEAGAMRRVDQDIEVARRLQLLGTPSFVVNGKLTVGVPTLAALEHALGLVDR